MCICHIKQQFNLLHITKANIQRFITISQQHLNYQIYSRLQPNLESIQGWDIQFVKLQKEVRQLTSFNWLSLIKRALSMGDLFKLVFCLIQSFTNKIVHIKMLNSQGKNTPFLLFLVLVTICNFRVIYNSNIPSINSTEKLHSNC